MDYYDFQVHLYMCLTSERVDNEFKMLLNGVGATKKTASDIMYGAMRGGKVVDRQSFDPSTGDFAHKSQPKAKIFQKFDHVKGKLL